MIEIDMKMPSCCDECFAFDDYGDYPFCLISKDQRGYTFNTRANRMPSCPLKDNEPRVLTFEKTDAIAHQTEETAIYLERKSDKSLYAAIAGDTQGRVPNISWLGEKRNYTSEYGKTWRCWSAKPTEEQRKATPWTE